MPTYRVVDKTTNKTVYAYGAEAPVGFAEYPFADYHHVVEVAVRVDGTIDANDPRKRVTKRAFWNRFPAYNEMAMRAVMTAGSPQMLAAALERLKSRVDASPFVDLALQETIDGVSWLASAGVPEVVQIDGSSVPFRLTAAQADAVLNAPVAASEAYTG